MSYKRVVPQVVVAHLLILGLVLLVPLLRSCDWFRRPPLETIEIDLGSLPAPPPPPQDPPDPEDIEEENVIPESTPVPTPRPTAEPTPVPTATATPRPQATPTPRPRPTPTPTPAWRARTPEEIRRDIENRSPEPVPTVPPLSPEDLRDLIADGLPSTDGPRLPGPGGPGGGAGVNFGGIAQELQQKFYAAWNQPRHLSGRSGLKAVADIEVARNGDVLRTRITTRSGIGEFDTSVQNALDTVTFVQPLPDGFEGASRTFTLQFELTP